MILVITMLLSASSLSAEAQFAFEAAHSFQQRGEYRAAELAYRAFLKEQPGSVPALTNLGVVLAHEGKFPEAIDAYTQALKIDQTATPAKINLALAYYRTSDWANSEKWLKAVLQDDPNDKRALQLLGISYLQSGEYGDAAATYERLLPSSEPSILIGLSSAYRELGEKSKSERLLASLLQDYPQSPEVQYLLGLAEYARQDFDEAADAFTKTITLAPNRVDGYFYLGATYFKQRKFDNAIQIWTRAVSIDPEHFPSTFALGALLAELNRYSEARPYLQQALAQRPQDAATNLELGRLCLREGRLRAALTLLKNACELNPKSQQASFLLANTYRKLGNESAAVAEFQRSQGLLSEDTMNTALSEATHVSQETAQ